MALGCKLVTMSRRRPRIVVLVVAALVAWTAPVAAVETTTGGGTLLPINGFSHLVVDDAHQRVLISSGPGQSKIAVVDFNGAPTGTIDALPGPTGMVVVG